MMNSLTNTPQSEYIEYTFTNSKHSYKLYLQTYFRDIYKIEPNQSLQELSEYTTMLEVVSSISSDKVIIDIGANSGLFTIPCALLGYTVISFEPVATNIQSLKLAKDVNNCSNITIVEKALSDKDDQTVIYVPLCPDNSSLDASAAIKNMPVDSCREETINIVKFDNWYEKSFSKKDIGLIKIDVQGYEHAVITGMKTYLQNVKDLYLIIEWDQSFADRFNYSLEDLHDMLTSFGFENQLTDIGADRVYYKPVY